MVKNNYAAWHVNASNFSETWSNADKLKFFARYAVLAPSGHNTQPWLFRFGGNCLYLEINQERNLPFSGTLAAEPYVSLGACLETLVLAAKGYGYELEIMYNLKNLLVATIRMGDKIKPDSKIPDAITRRVSNRSKFTKLRLPSGFRKYINADKLEYVGYTEIEAREDIKFLADVTDSATRTIMHESAFREELSHWVRNNFTRKPDGMPGFVQEMPALPSLLAKHIIKHVDISKSQAKTDASRVLNSSSIMLLAITEPRSEAFLNIGRLYARICIVGEIYEVASSGVGASAIDPSTKELIRQRFNLSSYPTALIRLGKPTKNARHSPRWTIEKVTAKS